MKTMSYIYPLTITILLTVSSSQVSAQNNLPFCTMNKSNYPSFLYTIDQQMIHSDSTPVQFHIIDSEITENNTMNITIYPNPFAETLIIQTEELKMAKTVELIDSEGNIVLTENIPCPGANMMLETSQFSRGIYYVLVRNDSDIIAKRKVHRL